MRLAITEGRSVVLRNVGTLETHVQAPRRYRDARTGKRHSTAPVLRTSFALARSLRDSLESVELVEC